MLPDLKKKSSTASPSGPAKLASKWATSNRCTLSVDIDTPVIGVSAIPAQVEFGRDCYLEVGV